MKVRVVAPARTLPQKAAQLAEQVAADLGVELQIDPQCFDSCRHFAGGDGVRAKAFIQAANDSDLDALWFARGGYGSARIVGEILDALDDKARSKIYLGYSDTGVLLGALDRRGIGQSVHGPMVADGLRQGGREPVERVLKFLKGDRSEIEPSLDDGQAAIAFNASILAGLAGGPYLPDFDGRVLMIEEVDEHLYAFDRALFAAFSSGHLDKAAGVRLGRVSQIPENDVPFGETPEEIVQRWCASRGIPYLGAADIGHDTANKIVPFR